MVLNMTEKLLRIVDVAELLGVSKQAVWKRYQKGSLPEPDATAGGNPLWRVETIETWQEQQK